MCPNCSNILRFLSLYALNVVVLDSGNLIRKGKLLAVLIVSYAQKMKFPTEQASVYIKMRDSLLFLNHILKLKSYTREAHRLDYQDFVFRVNSYSQHHSSLL